METDQILEDLKSEFLLGSKYSKEINDRIENIQLVLEIIEKTRSLRHKNVLLPQEIKRAKELLSKIKRESPER